MVTFELLLKIVAVKHKLPKFKRFEDSKTSTNEYLSLENPSLFGLQFKDTLLSKNI